MSIQINPDQVAMQELAARGVDASVGVFGSHYVQIGKASPIRLDQIKSADVPFAWFKTATQVRRGREGVLQTAEDAIKVLLKPGALDAGKLLGLLKAGQTHLGRLAALGELSPAQKQDSTWVFTRAVQNLSNAELATVYQAFSSAEMDLLQTALQREGEVNRDARDARMAAERLFDLQALVLRESANRASQAQLEGMRAEAPNDASLAPEAMRLPRSATAQYGTAGGVQVINHEKDMSAQNLAVLVETAAASATARERSADATEASFRRRSFDNVTLKQIGDVMRSKELTYNMTMETLMVASDILTHPDRPIDTAWSLRERNIKVKSDGYMEKRDGTERTLFPELDHAQSKGETRPLYSAVNFQDSNYGAAGALYGNVTVVFKPEVARRATYTVNDSFHTVALTVDRKRRDAFFALFGGTPVIPDSLKLAVANPDSPERRALEEWFDRMEASCRSGRNMSGAVGQERDIPAVVKSHFHEPELGEDQALMGLVFKCFGDRSATRSMTATHDNMESLLPYIGEANSSALAQAAHDRANGRDPKLYLIGTAYLEAQIHGPVIPERDIAEIRVNLAGDDAMHPATPAQQAATKARLDEFSRRTGIRIVYVDVNPMDDSVAVSELSQKTEEINAAHHDNATIDRIRDEYIVDLPATVARFLPMVKVDGVPEGVDLKFSGKVLDRILEAFLQLLQEMRSAPASLYDSDNLVSLAFRNALSPIVHEKIGLLNEVMGLDYANPAEKQAFVQWLLQTDAQLTVEQVRSIHQHATAQAAQLRAWAAAEPPPTAEAVLAAFAGPLAGEGADPRHVTQVAVEFMLSAVPPPTPEVMQRLRAILDSAPLRGITAQLDAVAAAPGLRDAADAARATALAARIRATASTVAGFLRTTTAEVRPCILPLSAVPTAVRNAIRQVAPALADALDAAHPAHPAFPAHAHPAALPQNKAQRKEFLLSQMEAYRQKEIGPERGRSVHGRGHIIRAYFYATAFCNMLKEQGVTVDQNAVILGIIGHDLGRAGFGQDKWERVSGRMTKEGIRQVFGDDAADEAWGNEVGDSIASVQIEPQGARPRNVPVSPTLEAQLLQSADSLDIGRTGQFDPYYFDFMRDKNGAVSPEAQRLRDQLAEEADLLQRLTNPLCANRPVLTRIGLETLDADPKRMDELEKLRISLDRHVANQMIDEAENTDHAALFNKFEDAIRAYPQAFPLLTKYYLNAE